METPERFPQRLGNLAQILPIIAAATVGMLAALGGYTFVYACMNCHASVYVPFKKLGGGDIFKGFEKMNQMPYFEARKIVSHPRGMH